MAEGLSPTPAVPRFSRKDIIDMQDQLVSMNLEKEGLDFTGKGREMRRRLLEHFYPTSHFDVIYPGSDPGSTPLHDAAPVDKNLASDPGFTPLHVAAPVDINPASNSGITPLHDAVTVDINPASGSGVTPLHKAPIPYTVDHIKGFMVEQLRNISLELGLPILNEETNLKLSKPILREKLIAFIQAQDQNTNLNESPDPSQNIPDNDPWFLSLPRTGAVIQRVPKASRLPGSRSFGEVLDRVTVLNTKEAWENLYEFARLVLAKPPRAGKNAPSLATIINKVTNT